MIDVNTVSRIDLMTNDVKVSELITALGKLPPDGVVETDPDDDSEILIRH
jgi:hypothetical protein